MQPATLVKHVGNVVRYKKDLKDRLNLSMYITNQHSNLTNYQQFVAAVMGVYLISNEEDKEILNENLQCLATLSKVLKQPVELSSTPIPIPKRALGLLSMWKTILRKQHDQLDLRAKKLN